MICNQYSFFCLKTNGTFDILSNTTTVRFSNKIWSLKYINEDSNVHHIYKLYWIDLINYKQDTIHGQIDEVEIWSNNRNTFLIFTSSYSILNFVRYFLKEELGIETEIHSFDEQYLMRVSQSNTLISIVEKEDRNIVKISPVSSLEMISENSLFAIEMICRYNKKDIFIFVSIHGLIKLSYGLDKDDVLKVCDVLGIAL